MPSCVVKSCKNNSTNHKKCQGITYHRFPEKNTEWHKDWCEIIRNCRSQDDWVPSKTSVICSVHFDTNDLYTTKNGIRRVRTYAVPKILLFKSPKTREIREKPLHVRTNIRIAPRPALSTEKMPPIITGGWATLSEQLSSFEHTSSQSESVTSPQTTLVVQLKAEPEEASLYDTSGLSTSTYLTQAIPNGDVKAEPEESPSFEPSGSRSPSYLPQTTPIIEIKSEIEEPTSFEPANSMSTFAYLPQLPVKLKEESTTPESFEPAKQHPNDNTFFVMIPPNVGTDWPNESISTSSLPQTRPNIEVKTEESGSEEPSALDPSSTSTYLPQLPVNEEATTPYQVLRDKSKHRYVMEDVLRKNRLIETHKKKIKTLNQKIRRLEERNVSLKASLKEIKHNHFDDTELSNGLDENVTAADLFIHYKKYKQKHNIVYSPAVKKFCLTLKTFSPKAYDYVRQTFEFCLPHYKTLAKWKGNVNGPECMEESFQENVEN